MVAGRELDALVAEKVMGWTLQADHETPPVFGWWYAPGQKAPNHLPTYSTSISAAWEVVEKMATTGDDMSQGFQLEMRMYYGASIARFLASPPGEWMVSEYWNANEDKEAGHGKDAPHAICLAALAAVGALK